MSPCNAIAFFALSYAAALDISNRTIPDEAVVTVSLCAALNIIIGHAPPWTAIAGGVAVGVVMLLAGIDGIGGGDIKLSVAVGTLYGFPNAIFILLLAATLMVLYGFARRKKAVPFAPFLLFAAAALQASLQLFL